MRYFRTFPLIGVLNADGSRTTAVNIMRRIDFNPALFTNSLIFYEYNYQETDRPDIIASKYYENSYRYWIFLLSNKVFDPYYDLPLDAQQLNTYINDKYAAAANTAGMSVLNYIQTTTNSYLLSTTTYDSTTQQTTEVILTIDLDTYNNSPQTPSTERTYFDDGSYVDTTTLAYIQTISDYELQANEAKRQVLLLNKVYTTTLEKNLKRIMRQ
jgi:Base plate wedge protein 53